MFPDPSTTRIVHDTMIAEELVRQNPEHRHEDRAATVRLPAIRRRTARALTRLADRIAPAPMLEPERAA
jgi:hypothetical protein